MMKEREKKKEEKKRETASRELYANRSCASYG